MKYETKFKILNWVQRLLKWNPIDGMPFIIEQKREIQLIQYKHIYNQDEWKWVVQEQLIRKHIANAITNILSSKEVNAIKIEWEPDIHTAGIKVTGTLKYILP